MAVPDRSCLGMMYISSRSGLAPFVNLFPVACLIYIGPMNNPLLRFAHPKRLLVPFLVLYTPQTVIDSIDELARNAATGWLSSATAAFAGCILYKLDPGSPVEFLEEPSNYR